MLNGLIQTMIICMGMSLNGMPVCDYSKKTNNQEIKQPLTPKKAENNYSLTISNENVNIVNHNGTNQTRKYNLSANNSYVNIIGNTYQQQYYEYMTNTQTQTQEKTPTIANYYFTIENNTQYAQYYAGQNADITSAWADEIFKTMIILKITPYNFNRDTTIQLTTNWNLQSFTSAVGNYQYSEIWQRYRMYKSIIAPTTTGINNSFDKYINHQQTIHMVNTIEKEIIDPNQNYYYSITEETTRITQNGTIQNVWLSKTFDLDISQGMDNYFIIVQEPIAKPTTNIDQPKCYFQTSWITTPGNNTITGTNYIPTDNYEIIDLPGLMWEIIGMPFAFISQAFNLTLFPGTAYQLNIANLFLAIIALLIFIFIIKLIAQIKG